MSRLMRVRRAAAPVALVLAMVAPVEASAPPPIYVDGARVVDIRNADGGFRRYYTIPSTSIFRTTGGGAACSFVPASDGIASNGEAYQAGQRVQSERWLFVEGTVASFFDPNPVDLVTTAPLSDARRIFNVFCDSTRFYLTTIAVGSRDPMIDPRTQLANLYDVLQLIRPVVYRNPIVDRWGGLVTRYPSWLAVQPPAWVAQRSATVEWRGWIMSLVARPVQLDFAVSFRPDPDRPSTPFDGVVPCVARDAEVAVGPRSVPTMPALATQTTPGVNGPCMWTPPGPGTVTEQARLGYRVTFWANAYYEAQPDYLWTSAPVTFLTGDLSVVNVLR